MDRARRLSRPPPNQVVSARARGPETGDPEMDWTTLREMVTAPLFPLEEGRVENLQLPFLYFPPLAPQPVLPTLSKKEKFPSSLGPKWARRAGDGAEPDLFHPNLSSRHRPFLHFAFMGRAYQYKVRPFGLSLSPCVFTKVMEAALVPMRERGICILSYHDNSYAQSPQPVGSSGQLGKEQILFSV